MLRKNKKPTHRNADSPEARERMLEGASIPSNTQMPQQNYPQQQLVPNVIQTSPTNLQQVCNKALNSSVTTHVGFA